MKMIVARLDISGENEDSAVKKVAEAQAKLTEAVGDDCPVTVFPYKGNTSGFINVDVLDLDNTIA